MMVNCAGTNGGGFLSRVGPAVSTVGEAVGTGPMANNLVQARNVTLINNTAGKCSGAV